MELRLDELFREAMSHLASGVAVVTARQSARRACGISATSLVSYSAHPASLLVSVWHESRCHQALAECERFGVHLLRSDQIELAHRFADRECQDKFAGLDWRWDGDVPELSGALAYLRCRRAENFVRYDHTILIGDLEDGRLEPGDPLVYSRRRMDWLMQPILD
jgi:flavin reductase (DIM6/NTAB) family NADH-FMN oxidoreductase RutF